MGIDVRPAAEATWNKAPAFTSPQSSSTVLLSSRPFTVSTLSPAFRPSKPSDDGEKPQRCAATVGDAVWRLVGRKSCAGSSIGSSMTWLLASSTTVAPVPRLESLQLGKTGARRCPRRRRPRRPRRSHCRSAYEARERERLLLQSNAASVSSAGPSTAPTEATVRVVRRPATGGNAAIRTVSGRGTTVKGLVRLPGQTVREVHTLTTQQIAHRDGCSAGDRHSATHHGHGPAGDGYRRRDGEM